MRPLIGITGYTERASYWIVEDEETVLIPRGYLDMISAAGGTPVLLPPTSDAADAAAACDGVLVSGGPDIGAAHYGAVRGPHDDDPRPERDAADLAAVRRALDLGIPVLGVCRGHQLLNVALGGTLHQHLPDVVGDGVAAEHSAGPGSYAPVQVVAEPGSRAAAALGTEPVTVRCHHHQSVDRLGAGLRVTARAGAVVEAIETGDGGPWVLGVQSHPERSPDDLRLAGALVAAARSRSTTRTAPDLVRS
ncbi:MULTISPECIES: gamma-glutamyl-gamma-aminobutyrate hydrolase family protein [Pseudonocardia]|uniref:Gamma-glutamyl-gamma-aminobutyrate hydrolase n=2 Tax=Pseudonocardia TaxID=1847 RepID=A0ABQ0RRS9_9PSEU|nr:MULTISPECIES: gamma-glutamyl-gamma-aminobutyrate hydrolase family protein [Pseudonocardia]OSY43115.1 putative glutamine amidotransferase [Pseudonocardia autotrophica]TDN71603.1 putative glutamine amidotransferase [Pseudonocardia autotrophica]BBG02290.1 gamma-glutamyl-gamma-aminobutyrate hydrolase [Pseudonocardia autotrophica]GEC23374.1 gamma-glutamyl-gamma-aminobutyrate hydrolase [Pseudonocardia saturnea]